MIFDNVPNLSDEFLDGQRDCKNGVEHKPGRSEEYNNGYGCQYEAEQLMTEMGMNYACH